MSGQLSRITEDRTMYVLQVTYHFSKAVTLQRPLSKTVLLLKTDEGNNG